MRLDHLLSKEDGRVEADDCLVLRVRQDFQKKRIIPVAIRPGDTPVPIPNTMVKTRTADDTWLETARESRRLPDSMGV